MLYYIKVGFKGVFIALTCFPDGSGPYILSLNSLMTTLKLRGLNCIHVQFLDEISVSKQNSPRCDAASGAILFAYVP